MKKWKEELNASIVGATSSRPHFEGMTKNKGITLIALIITIIVMLILVGVTVAVALNGGIFGKGEEASSKTKIAQIKEALEIKKAEVLADNNGKEPSDYGIKLKDLNISENIKKEYESKLKISADGRLYYDTSVVTDKKEQEQLKTMGIEEYVVANKLNVWQERGLTEAISYDSIYYGTGGLMTEGLSIESMTLKVESQGGFSVTELDWNFSATDIYNMIEEGNCVVSSDSIVFYDEVLFKISNGGEEIILADSRRRIGRL